jgi:hypothetical protein
MENLTMSQLEAIGFILIKSYTHDEYVTQRRKKGCIIMETTWDLNKGGEFVSQDFTITEEWFENISVTELKMLDVILNKNHVSQQKLK